MKTLGTISRTEPWFLVYAPAACLNAGSTRVTGERTCGMLEFRGQSVLRELGGNPGCRPQDSRTPLACTRASFQRFVTLL